MVHLQVLVQAVQILNGQAGDQNECKQRIQRSQTKSNQMITNQILNIVAVHELASIYSLADDVC
jgi:hypothetical protein